MTAHLLLLLALGVFLVGHSLRFIAPGWRDAQIARLGEKGWKAGFSVVTLAAFVVMVWTFSQTRLDPVVLWVPPAGMRHGVALLLLPAFVLLVAAYIPANHLKAAVGHPMVAATKLWALAHLLANGQLADVLLFGGFLAWAIADFVAARRRDRTAGVRYPAGTPGGTVVTLVLGGVAWWGFAHYAHGWLFGVRPLG